MENNYIENNWYVGSVFHRKKLGWSYIEQEVLYSEDCYYFFDLLSEKWYSTSTDNKDYVIRETIVPTDIRDYKIDYQFLLEKNKPKIRSRIKSTTE